VPHQAAFARSTRRRSSQADDGTVLAELTGDADPAAAAAQLARIFSVDTDGSAFAQIAEVDPVVAELAARYPGLRPAR